MFFTNFIIYFVFDYACFMWICLKLVFGFFCLFWDKVYLFLVKTGWQQCCWSLGLKFRDWFLPWLKLTNLFSKADSVCLYYTIHI